jgi:hypothetical protein
MGQESKANDLTRRGVVYRIPEMEAVRVRRDVEYKTTGSECLTMDVYSPPGSTSEDRISSVVFVLGFSDIGARKILGCQFKEMESFVSWAKLAAASGLSAITYATGSDPAADVRDLLEYVRTHAASLGIDENRIGIWACSGHVPTALSVLMREDPGFLKCAVLCYGYALDVDGFSAVAEAARMMKFANPCSGRSADELSQNVPMFIARAGQDETPRLNESLDRFVAAALIRNLPMTVLNHREAPHAFDLFDDSERTRSVIRQILAFLRHHLHAR